MKNQAFADNELDRLQKIGKLKWNRKEKKWNKKFYPITDINNNFVKWEFGEWPRETCKYCGKILKTVKDDPYLRASRYYKIEHGKLHHTIISRAMKRFNLKNFDPETYNKKTWKNWIIRIPSIYQYSIDKEGKLQQKQIKDRVESKEIIVTINGKSFPYTTKSRTIQSFQNFC